MKFNKTVAKAVAAAVVSVLLALGIANTDKIGAFLDSIAAFVPDSAPPAPSAPDAGL